MKNSMEMLQKMGKQSVYKIRKHWLCFGDFKVIYLPNMLLTLSGIHLLIQSIFLAAEVAMVTLVHPQPRHQSWLTKQYKKLTLSSPVLSFCWGPSKIE